MARLFALLALICAVASVTVSHAASSGSRSHDTGTPVVSPTPTGYHFQVLACWQAAGTSASTQPKCLKKSTSGTQVQPYVYIIIYNVPPHTKAAVSLTIKSGSQTVSQASGTEKISATANIYPLGTTWTPSKAGTYKLVASVTMSGHTKSETAPLKVS